MRRARRFVCVSAVVLGGLALTPAAGAAPSFVLAPQSTVGGEALSTALTARLGVAGATVRLSRKAAGESEFRLIDTVVTDAGGAVTYDAAPRATMTYLAELPGDAEWLPASAKVTVTVRPLVRLVAPGTVYRGARARLAVQVVPSHPGATVTVETWSGGAWTTWRTLTLGDDSRAAALWSAGRVGRQAFRAGVAADEEHAAGASGVRRARSPASSGARRCPRPPATSASSPRG